MARRDIIVIGGSAGGIKALRRLTAGLPRNIPATLFVVIHTSPTSPGLLPEILSREGQPPALHATNEERFEPGTIYVAPPDQHLLIQANGRMRLTHGPKENRFRPAIDPLFRSAALLFGPRVVGVLLSGGLDDGVAGLAAIKEAGGLAVVQDPQEAEVSTLPRNAMNHVAIDHILPASEIAALLETLAQDEGAWPAPAIEIPAMKKKQLEMEVRLAEETEGFRSDILDLGNPTMFTCPDCHGTLMRINDQSMLRFRCHTGHAFTASSLLTSLTEKVEDSLWNSVRTIEESAMLLGHMASRVAQGDDVTGHEFGQAASAALDRAQAVRMILAGGPDLPASVEPAE